MPFGFTSTALEVAEGHDLTGYEIIVTGASSGIGVETVRALVKAGANVEIATRNASKAQEVADKLVKELNAEGRISVGQLDLTSLKNVRAYCARRLATKKPINILINNAGVMRCPLSYTEDGFEMHIGTNHFGHFALFQGLLPALKEGYAKLGKPTRVVSLSSCAHGKSPFLFDDYNFKTTEYGDGWAPYGQSKTANSLFAVEVTRRYQSEGIFSVSLHPGIIVTELQRHQTPEECERLKHLPCKSIEQGASTTVYAAISLELLDKGGSYLENCAVSGIKDSKEEIFKEWNGILAYAVDADNAKKLWDLSERLVKA